MDLAQLRTDTEALTTARERVRYRDLAGLAPTSDLEALFRARPEVADWDALAFVREATPATEGRRTSRLRALSHQLVRLIASRESLRQEEALARAERAPVTGSSAGAAWPLRVALDRLADEPRREARAIGERTMVAALGEAEPILTRQQEVIRSVLERAGWSSAGAAWSAMHDWDAQALATECRGFLDETAGMYSDVLDWWLRRSVGVHPFPHEAERHDLLHALSLREYQGLFPERRELARVLDPFLRSGVDRSLGGAIRFDLEAREDKTPQSFVSPVDAPGEVMAVLRAEGGFRDTRALLRVWGEARHFASVDAERPFEDRLLGDRAVPAAFGRLASSALLDRGWLKRALGEVPPDLRRLMALRELFHLRHQAVVVLGSREADTSGLGPGVREAWAERASAALGARWPGALMPWECDVWWAAGTEFLAACLEGVLFPSLQEQFNEDWWANPAAAEWMARRSGQGQLESARQVAASLGSQSLSLRPIAQRLQQAME